MSSKHLDLISRGVRTSLNHTNSKLQLYDGTTMSVKGTMDIWCMHNGQERLLTFHVVDGSTKPLLSADTCELFGLLTCHVQQAELCNTLERFADVFQVLGWLPGDYHIKVDPVVRPVQHMPRNEPEAVQQELRQHLQELVNMKVLSSVKEPTKWINSMVIAKKPNKFRLCLDPEDLNKAIKRPYYPKPTIDDIMPQLSKAKVCSVLDTKDGFWQVTLNEPSSYLTTFWTPFG